MSRRLVYTIKRDRTVKVYRDSDTSEFVARIFHDGKPQPSADYFTGFTSGDPQSIDAAEDDAIKTARSMAGFPAIGRSK